MKIQKCYRIVEVKDNEYYSLFHGTDGSRKMKKNKWLRADKKRVTDGSRKTATEYELGWHVLLTEQEAIDFFNKMFKIKENRTIIPVFVKTPLRRKEHSRRNVFLADEIYVSSEYYKDKNGTDVVIGDTIKFTLKEGILNKYEDVKECSEFGLYPPSMKYLEFEVVK